MVIDYGISQELWSLIIDYHKNYGPLIIDDHKNYGPLIMDFNKNYGHWLWIISRIMVH